MTQDGQHNPKPRTVTEAARMQFLSCFQMLETLVDLCPEEVWRSRFHGLPFWYHAYHVAYFFDYWFREEYGSPFRQAMAFDSAIPPEFEHEVGPDLLVPQGQMRQYLCLLREKAGRFFDGLHDGSLAAEALAGQRYYTYADIIFSQVRHAMYNIGYLNGILRSLGLEESDWYAYHEEE